MNLPDDIIKEIIYFLPNEDVFNMCIINKHINNIFDDNILRNIIIFRQHPVIFNILGNFCFICNLRLILLCDDTIFGTCNHL